MAGYQLYGKEEVPAGGIITGIGRVSGYVARVLISPYDVCFADSFMFCPLQGPLRNLFSGIVKDNLNLYFCNDSKLSIAFVPCYPLYRSCSCFIESTIYMLDLEY